MSVWSEAVGADRLPHAFAWQSLHGAGARLVFGTDWPASISVAPLRGIHNAVNRRTLDGEPEDAFIAEQRVSLGVALDAFTGAGAFASFNESRRGSLREGALADFVVLSRDIHALEPMDIMTAEPLLTVVGGQITWRSSEETANSPRSSRAARLR